MYGSEDGLEDGLIHCFKEGEPCQNGREQFISQLDVLDEPDRPNPFDLITDSEVDEADNAVFWIEAVDEIIDVDIYSPRNSGSLKSAKFCRPKQKSRSALPFS